MPFLNGLKLVARAIEVAEEEKMWLLFCTKTILNTEPITFEDFCKASKQPITKKKIKKTKKKTTEELIAEIIKINEKLKGGKPK
jgi:predicted transglutaminase-like cysteine proteinase